MSGYSEISMPPLSKRLSQHPRGSYELNVELELLIGTMPKKYWDSGASYESWIGHWKQGPTTNLERAFKVIKESAHFKGWFWQIEFESDGYPWVSAAPEAWTEGLAAPDRGGVSMSGQTLALAICAAAAKIMEEKNEPS